MRQVSEHATKAAANGQRVGHFGAGNTPRSTRLSPFRCPVDGPFPLHLPPDGPGLREGLAQLEGYTEGQLF